MFSFIKIIIKNFKNLFCFIDKSVSKNNNNTINNNNINIFICNRQKNVRLPFKWISEEKIIYDLLENFWKNNPDIYKKSPANMFKGALVVLKNNHYKNHEKIHQAACSLRRIIEPFYKKGTVGFNKSNDIYKNLSKFVHDDCIDLDKFGPIKSKFMEKIPNILQPQKSLHTAIEYLIAQNGEKKINKIRLLINKNPAARQHFYKKVNVSWLDWLTTNGFLNFEKIKNLESDQYIYHQPELYFLKNVLNIEPEKVTNIICNVEISKEKNNLELILQFWIIAIELPVNQLIKIIAKQKKEKWIQISGQCIFLDSIIEKLLANKKYNEFLTLAEDVLSFKKETNEPNQTKSEYDFLQNPIFSLESYQLTNVFDYLQKLPNEYNEKGLQILCKKLSYFFKLELKTYAKNSVFEFGTHYAFDKINFFKFQANQHRSQNDEITIFNICYTIIFLAQKLIEVTESSKTIRIFDKYFKTLPKSRVSWRLQLFILSLKPKIFAKYLKNYFSQLFEQIEAEKNFVELINGAEYKTTLKKTFEKFDDIFKREFVNKIFFYYEKIKEKNSDSMPEVTKHFSEILSSICASLTEEEKKQYEQVFAKKCDSQFVPDAYRLIQMESRRLNSISDDELSKLTVPQIVEKLKTIWKPKNLVTWLEAKEDQGIFVDDLVAKIKKNMLFRLDQYLNCANLFFQREEIDPIYTNVFLLTCVTAIHEKNIKLQNYNFGNLIEIMNNIRKADKSKPLFIEKKRFFNSFDFADWNNVRISMGCALEYLLQQKKEQKFLFDAYKYRFEILEIIDYLISCSQTTNELIELDKLLNETFNTLAGWGFESLTHLLTQAYSKKWSIRNNKFVNKVKDLMERFIEEKNNTQLMFLFGYHINFFYWLDSDWLYKVWSKVFFVNSRKKEGMYMPAWFGYLSGQGLPQRFFDLEIQSLYWSWLQSDKKSLDKKSLSNINSKVVENFAWTFLCFDEFNFSHALFKEFYLNQNVNLQSLFIKFIGQHFIPLIRTDIIDYFKKHPQKKVLFEKLWDKTLTDETQDKQVLEAFGYWMHTNFFPLKYLVSHIKKTLKKTEGFLEEGMYLKKAICELAEKKPNDTIEIIALYLIRGDQVKKNKIDYFDVKNYWEKCFEILSKKKDSKENMCQIIDVLVEKRGNSFVKLMKFCKN